MLPAEALINFVKNGILVMRRIHLGTRVWIVRRWHSCGAHAPGFGSRQILFGAPKAFHATLLEREWAKPLSAGLSCRHLQIGAGHIGVREARGAVAAQAAACRGGMQSQHL
jgi:hypothetical protein